MFPQGKAPTILGSTSSGSRHRLSQQVELRHSGKATGGSVRRDTVGGLTTVACLLYLRQYVLMTSVGHLQAEYFMAALTQDANTICEMTVALRAL